MAKSLVSALLEKLTSHMIHEFELALSAKEDLRKLENTFLTIKDVLEDAESQSMKGKSLFNWLAKLKDATYDMDDLLDYIQMEIERRNEIHDHMIKKVRCFFSRSNPIIFRFKIGHMVKKMRERLDEISANRTQFNFETRETKDRKTEVEERRETSSMFDEKNICGRDGDKEMIVNFLLETNNEKNLLILPIVGMGGLGKTTLAQLVYNDERVKRKEQFEVRGWVYVSEVFYPKKIAEDAILSATGQSYNKNNLDFIGNKLKNLLRDKRFLLVLDDVWNVDQEMWNGQLEPMLNVGRKGSRIIVTTRIEKIASIMGNITPYNLEKLSDDDCWKLFKQRALGEESGEENACLVKIGMEIIKKCGGVPLVAKALGSILQSVKEEEEWLKVRDHDFWKLTKEGERVLASLKLSYTHLPQIAKQCFAYCSLFPKGYEFEKDVLISQWIAQGFVRSIDGSSQMESIANTHFNNLLRMSFLQNFKNDIYSGEVTYKMHDLVHDLAEFVSGDEILVEKAEKTMTDMTKGYRYVALMGNSTSTKVTANSLKKVRALHVFDKLEEFLGSILSSANCLRTLNLDYGRIKSLPKLNNLRYLRASILNIKRLPESICCLQNLQCMSLSNCFDLKTLPKSFGDLCNLRNLKLTSCGSELQPFPDSFESLEHLVSLDLSYARMELLPIKSFGGLQNLHSINFSRCERLKELPDSIGDAKNLRSLNIAFCARLQALPESTSNLTQLESLNLSDCRELQELPKGLGNMRNLKHLNIRSCFGLRGMPRDMRQLTNLQTLPLFLMGKEEDGDFSSIGELEHLNRIEGELWIGNLERVRNPTDAMKANLKEKRKINSLVLSWLRESDEMEGVLECLQPPPSIKELEIRGYWGSKNPSWLASSASLPNLASLAFRDVKRIDRLPAALFPSLTELKFFSKSNLKEWTTVAGEEATNLFPRLKKLEIWGCPKLKVRPWIPASVEELVINLSSNSDELLSNTSLRPAASSSRLRILSISEPYYASSTNLQWTGLRHLASSLQELAIIYCRELRCLPESIGHLASLRSLRIEGCPSLTSLPNGMRHLALDELYIRGCRRLKEIPEWVGELQSLRSLNISNCPGLTSLPTGMRHLALHCLSIYNCPRLEERCERERGEDWHIISHIPRIDIV